MQPPLLPEETCSRVLRLAKLDGTGVLALGALFAVLAAAGGEAHFAIVGLLAAAAGTIELHGASLLQRGEARGIRWLVASQPFLLGVIYAYCALRLTHFEMPPVPERFREAMETTARELGLTLEEYFRLVNRLTAQIVAGVATIYQGWMTVYYFRRRAAVEQAIAELPEE
jgi:hypothetical protein